MLNNKHIRPNIHSIAQTIIPLQKNKKKKKSKTKTKT